MPYKVVQTIERGETCLTVIPSGWEENGILHWPKKNAVAKLTLDEFSVPSPKWERINCVKKREFKTRAEAENELERMEPVSDTEAEEAINHPPPPKRVCPGTTHNATTVKDFNEVFLIPGQEVDVAPVIVDEVQNQINNKPTETIMFYTTGSNDCEQEAAALVQSPDSIQKDDQHTDILTNQQVILENQQIIVNNQIKLMQAIAKMQTGVDYLIENNMFGNSQPKDPNKILLKPVDSLQEINALEESLKESAAAEKFITNMGFICGTDGKASGMDCSYKLIDYFITREFMHSCSWTGNAKVTDENTPMNTLSPTQPEVSGKVPLKFYVHFRSLFLKLIRLADKDFTEVKCDEFFKRVMKNSKARLQAKSSSKHKNRPSNLKYKSHKGETSDGNNGLEETAAEESLQPTQQL